MNVKNVILDSLLMEKFVNVVMLKNTLKLQHTLLKLQLLMQFISNKNVLLVLKPVVVEKFVKKTDLIVKTHQPQLLLVMMLP